jgi:O-antigen/teichoic acid export membrane protein
VSHLGLAAFGVWAISGAVAQYGALFDLGLTRSVTRFVALSHARGSSRGESETLTVAVGAVVIVGFLLVPTCWWVAFLLQLAVPTSSLSELRFLLNCSVVVLIGGLLSKCLSSLAFGRGRMVTMNILLAVGSCGSLSGGVASLIWFQADLASFALASAVGAVVGLLVVVIGLLSTEGPIRFVRPSRIRVRELLAFGSKGQSILVADLLVFQSSKIVLGAILGPSAAGAYELGSRIALGGRAFGTLPSNALTPVLTREYAIGGLEILKKTSLLTVARTTCVGVYVPFGVAAVAPVFMPLWLGHVPANVTLIAIFLSLAFVFNIATGLITVTALAAGEAGVIARAALSTALCNALFIVPAVMFFGQWGALGSICGATILGACYGVRLGCRRVGLSQRAYWRAVSTPLLIGSLSCGLALTSAALWVFETRIGALVGTAASVAIYSVTFIALSYQFGLVHLRRRRR